MGFLVAATEAFGATSLHFSLSLCIGQLPFHSATSFVENFVTKVCTPNSIQCLFPLDLNLRQTYLLLLLPGHFSRVRLCVTAQTAARQAFLSLGFSSKNTGVGCHFLLQYMKVKSESEVAQLCLTLGDPMGLPGSSAHGILQARAVEWVAIAFSEDKLI